MLSPLGYSGVHETVPLNLYTYVQMLHCLCSVYILNASHSSFYLIYPINISFILVTVHIKHSLYSEIKLTEVYTWTLEVVVPKE